MRGNATEIEIHAAQLEKMKAKLNRIIAEATGMDLEKVSVDTDRDYWLSAEEALSYGLVSKIAAKREEL
jgi:ATP-dependent Clp protease protease subunit